MMVSRSVSLRFGGLYLTTAIGRSTVGGLGKNSVAGVTTGRISQCISGLSGVVPKCATDRSLAIAHGLVDAFWREGSDGQWQPREVGQVEIDRFVRERSSAAVKAALSNLLKAPVPIARRASPKKVPKAREILKSMVSARPKMVSKSTSSYLRHSKPVNAVLLSGVKNAIRANASGATKSDVIGATGITASEWKKAIKALLADGSVKQTGQRRGACYHLQERDI